MDIHGVRFCYVTGIYTGTFWLDARFLHNQTADSNSVNGTLFTGFLATQRYKVHFYAMDIHGVRFCYGSVVKPMPGKDKSSTVEWGKPDLENGYLYLG